MSKGLYYFAHPYTVKDAAGVYVPEGEEANFRICCYRAGELLRRGYNVYSPIAHTHPIHVHTPDFLAGHEHKIWYALDDEFIALARWNGIILAPGWENSWGCRHERELFEARGLPVLLYADLVKEEPTYGSHD